MCAATKDRACVIVRYTHPAQSGPVSLFPFPFAFSVRGAARNKTFGPPASLGRPGTGGSTIPRTPRQYAAPNSTGSERGMHSHSLSASLCLSPRHDELQPKQPSTRKQPAASANTRKTPKFTCWKTNANAAPPPHHCPSAQPRFSTLTNRPH